MVLHAAVILVVALAPPPSEPEGPNAALLAAVEAADAAAIRSALEAGAAPDVRNAQKQTPLILAALKGATEAASILLEAKVDPEGRVTEVSVSGTPSLMDAAAVDAVRQWRYAPTVLCGTPVPVVLTVSVSLSDELRLQDKRANRSFSRY